jgi:hypothetical protein
MDGLPTGNGKTLHKHHVIPQAFGGANGPTVDLCSDDHNLLHSVALCMTGKKPYAHLITDLEASHKKEILWLASRVAIAYEATKNDPNKRVQVTVVLPAKLAAKLDALMKVYNLKSRPSTIERLIKDAHSRTFLK